MLVIAPGHEPAFFSKTDPLRSPLTAPIKTRSTADIPAKNVILGRVLNSAGAPIDKAIVSVEMVQQGNIGHGSPPPGTDPIALTEENGEFAIYSKQPFDHMQLKVEARTMAPKRFNKVRGGRTRSEFVVTEGALLRGRVLLNGKALKDVSIGAVSVDRTENFSGDFEYATREDGTFVFPNLPPNRDYYVYGMMKSLAPFGALPARMITIGGDGKVTDSGDLTVVPGFRLSGKMVLSDQKPLPPHSRLTISRREAWDVYAIELPPTGEFSVANLPGESLSIGGRVEGYRFSGRNASLDRLNPFGLAGMLNRDKTNLVILQEPGEMLPSEWDPTPPEERPESLPLAGIEEGSQRKVWVITGKVVDAETKVPINNAQVTSARTRGGRTDWLQWETTRTALSSNGVFRLELPPGKDSRVVKVIAPKHLPAISRVLNFNNVFTATSAEILTGRSGESVVDFELKPGEGPSGILISITGEPLAGVKIFLLGPSEQGGLTKEGVLSAYGVGDEAGTVTGEDGAFNFPARLGETELFAATKEGFVRAVASKMAAGERLQLRRWSRVRGILKAEGKLIPNENVDLRWQKEFSGGSPYINLHGATTDEDGAFQIENVPPGKMSVALRRTDGFSGGWTSTPIKAFDAPEGEEVDLGIIEVPRATLSKR